MSTLWIISGPSSVGKSTFIQSAYCRALTGLPAAAPALTPYKLLPGTLDQLDGCFLHYDLLRAVRPRPWEVLRALRWSMVRIAQAPWLAVRQRTRTGTGIAASSRRTSWSNLTWESILSHPIQKKAIVLVASRDTILQRVKARSGKLERRRFRIIKRRYNGRLWLDSYARVDLAQIYADWLAELRRQDIEYLLVNSTTSDYSPIVDAESIPDIIHPRCDRAICDTRDRCTWACVRRGLLTTTAPLRLLFAVAT